jgi:putative ABC transport system ATP-binding protein
LEEIDMEKALQLQDVTRYFGSGTLLAKVLKGISVDVECGEFMAIMGKSGAGKSTLLYQMSLLDEPTGGSVTILGTPSSQLKERKRTEFRLEHFGFIFQYYALVPELTAYENVALPLLMAGWELEEVETASKSTLEMLGLGSKFESLPSQLSGGEQQRVSIARAVAKKPSILFADEPTANLDNQSSEDVINALRDIYEQGQTIVMVTHEHEYTKHCTRVLWMEDGLIDKEIEPFKP